MGGRLTLLSILVLAACGPATTTTTPAAAAPAEAPPGAGPAPLGGACAASKPPPDPTVFHFVASKYLTWEPSSTLDVVFLDGKPEYRAKVEAIARQWTTYANVDMTFDDPAVAADRARVRVSFERAGYWSAIGSSSRNYDGDEPTMNFAWQLFQADDREIQRVVLHEFGHALGLFHEHQNPKLKVTWNRQTVYDYYRDNHGWSEEMVDSNIFRQLESDTVDATEFDDHSIMLYTFPPEFTAEALRMPYNTDLSAVDKQEIAGLYPGRVEPGDPEEPVNPEGVEPPDPQEWASKIKFDFAVLSESASDGRTLQNYGIYIDAPADVLVEIDHVLYQRQHASFPEYAAGTFYRSAGPEQRFAFEWQGWGWSPVLAKVVYSNGTVSEHLHRDPPRRPAARPNWQAIRDSVTFVYAQTEPEGGWSVYAAAVATDDALPYIAWVDYQRQHASFVEFAEGRHWRSDSRDDRYALVWRGYGWVPITVKVGFRDGSVADYKIDGPPVKFEPDDD